MFGGVEGQKYLKMENDWANSEVLVGEKRLN